MKYDAIIGGKAAKILKTLLRRMKNLVKKALKEAKNFKPKNYSRARYFWYREHCPLNEKLILIDCAAGKIPAGNMTAILKELAAEESYKEYSIYLSGGMAVQKERKKYLTSCGLQKRVHTVTTETLKYYKILATAKFLVSEDSLIYIFTKREGQVYLNTWHGTPLMTMGKSKKTDFAMLGNEQKTFFDADYLLCPNELTANCFIKDYMLENFGQAKLLLTGYPRNEAFLDKERREQLRAAYGLTKKQVIAYLPTWRKNTKEMDKEARTEHLNGLLQAWDKELSEPKVVYVKQHLVNAVEIDFTKLTHILPFPETVETYEFLNASDALVTDYSSVMFDYALTGRKIVLFVYDKEEYEEVRGWNLDLAELPFAKAETIKELKEALEVPKAYEDSAFLEKFCPYETENVTKQLCRRVFLGEHSPEIEEREIPYNGKKNVVFYIGGFEKNGLTTAGANLLHKLDRTKNNYAVIYCMSSVKKRQESIRVIPEDVSLISYYYYRCLTFAELLPYVLWRGFKRLPYSFAKRSMERLSVRGAQRMFGNCRVDSVVQFSGYNDEMIGTMEQMPCNRVIYVHSDMEKEISMRANANKGLLSHAYKAYDSVAAVTEGMIPPAKRIAESDKEEGSKEAHIVLCRNVIDNQRIRTLGEMPLVFDETTVMNVEEATLRKVLASNTKKFVSVGRFSVEKGHERLIQAFEQLHKDNPDTCLIIVGGHGNLWNATVQQVEESSCPDAIYLVRYMSNPFPLVKQCDFFALSSLYEGFGLVLAEADVLGLPCFTADIAGPRGFMQKYHGLLVENSRKGLYDGMCACMNDTIPKRLEIDYEQYNNEAVAQFESLL